MVLKSYKPFRSETLSGQNTLFVTVQNFLFQSIQKERAKLDTRKSLTTKNEHTYAIIWASFMYIAHPQKTTNNVKQTKQLWIWHSDSKSRKVSSYDLSYYVEVEKESEKTRR